MIGGITAAVEILACVNFYPATAFPRLKILNKILHWLNALLALRKTCD